MLAHGLDLRAPDDNGDLPIHEAARYGLHVAVQLILQRDPGVVDARNRTGCTPLMLAVPEWDRDAGKDTVRLLLQAGADVHVVDAEGKTALDHALAHDQSGAAKRLLAHARGDAAARADLDDDDLDDDDLDLGDDDLDDDESN
jgi:ankyrin repeat protein